MTQEQLNELHKAGQAKMIRGIHGEPGGPGQRERYVKLYRNDPVFSRLVDSVSLLVRERAIRREDVLGAVELALSQLDIDESFR